jgi:hypothetical protein
MTKTCYCFQSAGANCVLRLGRHGRLAKRTHVLTWSHVVMHGSWNPCPQRGSAPGLSVRELRQAHRTLRRRHLRGAHVHERREQRQRHTVTTAGLGSWPGRRCRRCRLSRLSCRDGGLVVSPKEAAGEVTGHRQACRAGLGDPPVGLTWAPNGTVLSLHPCLTSRPDQRRQPIHGCEPPSHCCIRRGDSRGAQYTKLAVT